MLTTRFPLFICLNLLLSAALASSETGEYSTASTSSETGEYSTASTSSETGKYSTIYNDRDGTIHCGRKIFIARNVKRLFDHAMETGEAFIPYNGQLEFEHDSSVWMLPIPTDPDKTETTRHDTRYFLIISRRDLIPLGMIYRIKYTTYENCIEGKAAGRITSVTPAAGSFQCQRFIITTQQAIEFAIRVRHLLLTTKSGLEGIYPIEYTGNLKFQGRPPFLLWRLGTNGKLSSNGKFMMVFDSDLNVVGALESVRRPNLPCRVLEGAELEAKILAPPIKIGPDEYDAFRCGLYTIKASKVQHGVRGAPTGFDRKLRDKRTRYPEQYIGDLLRTSNGPLFLWPVRMGEQDFRSLLAPSRREPFLAIINESVDIIGVVVMEKQADKYRICKRVSVKARSLM